MKWLRRGSSLFLMAFSVLIFISSLDMGIGDLQNPGPGFMALLASILLFSLSSVVLIKNLMMSRRNDKDEQEEEKGSLIGWEHLKKPIILGIALAAYTFILETIGFLIATFFLMFVMVVTYESKKWYKDLLIAALVAGVSFLIFDRWLQVRLPTGELFHM
jgi:putative tricarboxylic transport membrane protein